VSDPRFCPSCGGDDLDQKINGEITCEDCGFIVVDGDDSNVRGFY